MRVVVGGKVLDDGAVPTHARVMQWRVAVNVAHRHGVGVLVRGVFERRQQQLDGLPHLQFGYQKTAFAIGY